MTTANPNELSSLINLLRAAGASYLECMAALQAQGWNPMKPSETCTGPLGILTPPIFALPKLVDTEPNVRHRPDIRLAG